MAFELPALPYDRTALEPHITGETIDYHHGKHHNAYVVNLNNLTKDSDLADKSLEDVIQASAGDAAKVGIFNNAAQIWNHTFYWHCMKPFTAAATTQFGSGWAWLVLGADGKLAVTKTANADLPMAHGQKALLTIDVWEHAYYIDFRNLRPKYIGTFLESLVNWDFVNANLAG